MMNRINHSTTFTAALRSILLLGTLLFTVNVILADEVGAEDVFWWTKYLNEDRALVIDGSVEEEEEPRTIIVTANSSPGELTDITIKEATLVIKDGVMLQLMNEGTINIGKGGTLSIASTLGTGIFSGTPWWENGEEGGESGEEGGEDEEGGEGGEEEEEGGRNDEEGEEGEENGIEITRTTLHVDGGTIQITRGEHNVLYADTIDTIIGADGGTIDIAADVTFQSGTLTGGDEGDILKIGEGTFQVGDVNMGGNFIVTAGTVEFLGTARIGGDFLLENGIVVFNSSAGIFGNFIVGKKEVEETEEEGDPIVHTQEGTVTFHGEAYIAKDFTIESGRVEFLNTARIDGILDVREGEVTFGGNAMVGAIKSAAGTVISGTTVTTDSGEIDDEENPISTTTPKPHLTIATAESVIAGTLKNIGTLQMVKGGEITGILTDIDYLIVGDGYSSATLEFFGNAVMGEEETLFRPHTIGKIGVTWGAVLDLKDGAVIKLGSTETAEITEPTETEETTETATTYDDLIIEGTLKVSSAALGIYKGDDISHPDSTYLTVVGRTDPYSGDVIGGIVEIYKSDPDSEEPEVLIADTLHTQVIGIGKIIVADGVTFQSGRIGIHSEAAGAHVIVSGGGTYRAAEVDIGTGYFVVESGTKMDFLESVRAGVLIGKEDTQINTYGDAVFDMVDLGLFSNYNGNGQNLTMQRGGWVQGNITGVKELRQESGTLFLRVDKTSEPTIRAETWTIDDPANTRIRTVGGTTTGYYQKVIELTGEDNDWDQLLAILNGSRTALYRPEWSQSDNYLNLNLNALSVDKYVRDVWHKRGRNAGNIGKLIENVSARNDAFREYLEGLTDAQLQSTLRNALAGELAGNAFRIAMNQPAHTVFRHLDTAVPLRSPFQNTRGQVREGFHVWFNPYGQAEQAKGDADTLDGYKLSKYGFSLGGDIEIYNRAIFGTFFGYSAPYVTSDLGKISANDYTAGLYLRIPTVWEVVTNMMIGFGSQDYTYKNTSGKSKFRGGSFFGSLELTRSIPIADYRLTPLVALDFQSAMMDNFIVPGSGSVLVDPGDLSSAVVRVGLLGEIGRFRSRLQYMRQIAGEDVASSQTSIVGDLSASTEVRGTQWGKDWLNVGVGGEILRTQHWRIFADYNFDAGKRTMSHVGSLNTVLTW